MIVVHHNSITEKFVQDSLAKIPNVNVSICNRDEEIETLCKGKNMYYDLIFIEVNISYDYKRIQALIKKESEELQLILMFDNLDDYRKCILMLKKKNVDYKGISIKSIKEEIVEKYLIDIFNRQHNLSLKNSAIKTIYKYLLYKSNISKEISNLASLRTEAKIKKYISDSYKISASTFAHSLLLKKNPERVYRFVLENVASLNYLMAILSNYVDSCLETYEIMYDNKLTKSTAGNYYVDDMKLNGNKRYSQFMEEIDMCQTLGYRKLYILKQACIKANTKFKKQRLLLELIV